MKLKIMPIIICLSLMLVLLSGCGQGISGETDATESSGEMVTAAIAEETEATVSAAEFTAGFNIENGLLIGYTGADSVVSIPDNVTGISDFAFYECESITSVTVPDSVTNIGIGTFSNCGNLTSIDVDISNASFSSGDGVLYNKDMTALLCYPAGKTGVFAIPESVTSICESAFSGCWSLTGVTVPDSVTEIGVSAFSGCIGLTSVAIPDGVTSIREGAFFCCTGLTSVTIPSSVTEIAGPGENSVNLGGVVLTTYTTGAFEGCDSLTIYGETGSYAEQYAADNNIPFVSA